MAETIEKTLYYERVILCIRITTSFISCQSSGWWLSIMKIPVINRGFVIIGI